MEEDSRISLVTGSDSTNGDAAKVDNVTNASEDPSPQVNTDNEHSPPSNLPEEKKDSEPHCGTLDTSTDPPEKVCTSPLKTEESEKFEPLQKDPDNVLEKASPSAEVILQETNGQTEEATIEVYLPDSNEPTDILFTHAETIQNKDVEQVIETNEPENDSSKDQNPLVESTSENLKEDQNKSIDNEVTDVTPETTVKEQKRSRSRSSRELKSLIASAKESKIISECTQVKTKMRKSKTNDTNNSNTSIDSLKPNRRSSTASQLSSSSSKSEKAAKRSMRSQNPDFVSKQKLFLNSVTGRLARDHWDSVSEADSNDDTSINITGTPIKDVASNDSIAKETLSKDIKKSRKKPPAIPNNISLTDSSEIRSDPYCWQCHWNIEPYPEESRSEKNTDKPPAYCSICPRSFHYKCLNSSDKTKVTNDPKNWACPECLTIVHVENSVNRSPTMKKVSLGKLCELLQYAWDQIAAVNGTEPFMEPVDRNEFPNYDMYIVNPMCLNQIKDNIMNKCYGSTEAFLSDIQWIVHNSIIFNAAQSKLTVVARSIARASRVEMAEIETCPECYAGAHARRLTFFTDVCSNPHILLWAKLKGFPYWPAKGMSVNSLGQVDVRFFGAHDRARVPARDCYLYSFKDPNNFRNKKQELHESMQEAEEHVRNLARKYGKFVHAPFQTKFDPMKWNEQLLSMIPNYECDMSTPRTLDKHSNMSSPAIMKPKITRHKGYHEIETDGSEEDNSSRSTSAVQDELSNESLDKSLRRKIPNKEPVSPIIEAKKRRKSAFQEPEVTSTVSPSAKKRKRAASMFVEDPEKISQEEPKKRKESAFRDADITIRIRKSQKTTPAAPSADSDTSLSKTKSSPDLCKEITDTLSEIPKFIISKESPRDSPPIKIAIPKAKIIKDKPKIVTSTPKSTEKQIVVHSTQTTPTEKKDGKTELKVKPIRLVRNILNRKSLLIQHETAVEGNKSNKNDTSNEEINNKNKENDKTNNKGKEVIKIQITRDDKNKKINENKEAKSSKTEKEVKSSSVVDKEGASSNENKEERSSNADKEGKRKVKISKSNDSPNVNGPQKKATPPKRPDNFIPTDSISISNLSKTNFNNVKDVPTLYKISNVRTLQQKTARTPPTAAPTPTTPPKASDINISLSINNQPVSTINNVATNNNISVVTVSAPSQTLVGRVGVRSFARMQSPPSEASNKTVEVEIKDELVEVDDMTRHSEKLELMNSFRLRPVNPQNASSDVHPGPASSKPGPSKAKESQSKAKKSFPQSKNTEESLSGKNTMVYIPAQIPSIPAPIRSNVNQIRPVGRVNGPSPVMPRQIAPIRIQSSASISSTSIVSTISPTRMPLPLSVSMPATTSSVRMPVITTVNGQWALAIQPLSVGDSTIMNGVMNNNDNTNLIEVNAEHNNVNELPRLQRPPLLNPMDSATPVGNMPVPSSAGPITAKINQCSVKLTDFFRGLLTDCIEKIDTPASSTTFYKLQIEQLRWNHQQEILELKHNHNLMLAEVRASIEKEKARIINETRRTCLNELETTVNQAKSKQWCANCRQEAKMYCCWNTSYCDENCQRADWSRHCKVCRENRLLANRLKPLDNAPVDLKNQPGMFPEKSTLGRPTGSKSSQFIVGLVDDSRGGSTVRCVGSYIMPVTTQSQTQSSLGQSADSNLQVVTTGGYLIVGGAQPTCSTNSTVSHTVN